MLRHLYEIRSKEFLGFNLIYKCRNYASKNYNNIWHNHTLKMFLKMISLYKCETFKIQINENREY